MKSRATPPSAFLRHAFRAMGSPCEIQLFAADETSARKLARLVEADVERLEARYSRYRDDSLLARINRVAAVGGELAVDEETAALLNYADTCYRQSEGLFDVTSGILRRAWRFDQAELPGQDQIDALLGKVGWPHVRWTPPMLGFEVPGMELDFGGIVKEYAADRVAGILHAAGIRHAVVNLGGDIRIIGARADGTPWRVGIRHPRDPGGLLQSLSLRQGALASSGDYERCLLVDGVRYGHILNPRTGWPVTYLAAVSVVADLCVVAGSVATIAMLKGEAGPAWLEALGLPHLWVDVHGQCGGTLPP